MGSLEYESDVLEVSSGEFDAQHVKRYVNPKTFLHALWNTAGPTAGAMCIFLEILSEELKGLLIGVPAEFRDIPEDLIRHVSGGWRYPRRGHRLHLSDPT